LSSIKVSGPIPAHLARSVIEETLRNAILDGRLPCGTAMRQQELASLFGVSRMPVREALRQLEAQSLLHVVTHKGAVVAPLIEDNSAETYALRMLLESEALRLSIPLLSADDIAQADAFITGAGTRERLYRDRPAQPPVPHGAVWQGPQPAATHASRTRFE
jgi:DNA-binding GntR family transcriptional regulator